MKKIIISSLFLLLPLGSISYALNNEKDFLEISRNSSKELLMSLKQQLTFALKSNDTKKAVVVCSSISQDIAKNISEKHNLVIKRVSLKNRNPNGKPDEFEIENLKQFDELKVKNKLKENHEIFSLVKENNKEYFRYMKPIITAKSCLQCHGNNTEVKEDVKKILLEKYPNDIAFGYKEGDVRGAVSVKINTNLD
ncbi:MAG: DUF3365 domain-containing protein [Cyanobacteriota bacterium]